MHASLGRLAATLAGVLLGSYGGSSGAGDPCAGIDCSGHGICMAVADSRYCRCARGFVPVGDECIEPKGGRPVRVHVALPG